MCEDLPLALLIGEALEAAKRMECASATDVVIYLGARATEPELYRVCKAFADAGMDAAAVANGRRPDRAAGELWTFHPPETEGPLWALRFLAAHGNADSTMTRVLFSAAWENGTALEYTCALVGVVAAIMHAADGAVTG
jgi:hypothetical protein